MLSIIIVNYNGKRFLKECIDSIEEFAASTHEIIVVDNASIDGSCEYLKAEFPNVRLVESGKNLGFTGGNNLGARHARGEMLLLLNNDTRLLSSLEPAIREFENDERLGALGCRMSYRDGRFQSTVGLEAAPLRIILSWAGLGRFRSAPSVFKRMEYDESKYDTPQKAVAWVSGAFLMTRKGLWERLGGLDERYFMYMEDVDYCKRVRHLGYRVAYTPEVKIIHYEGGGRAWVGEKALKDTMRSYMLYTEKFYGPAAVAPLRCALSILMTARAFAFGLTAFLTKSSAAPEKAKACLAAAAIMAGLKKYSR